MDKLLKNSLANLYKRLTPFLDWSHELKNPEVLRADTIAGITVALILIPQSMAYAQLAGLPPEMGLYAAFLVPIVAALFGSSRQLQNGPVAIISLMTAAALLPLNLSVEQYIAYAAMLAIFAGLIQVVLGLLKLGILVDFLSHPVVIGFTNAAAIVISSLQISKILGIDNPSSGHLYETLWQLILAIPLQTHLPTFAMGLFSLGLLVGLKRHAPKLPGILITVIITIIVSWALDYASAGGQVVGEIQQGLPNFKMPMIEVDHIGMLVLPALMIALLSFVEAFSIAKAVASKTRQHLSANQEMVGKGLANIVAGVTQGYAVSGSFSRTAVAYNAGARTGLTAIVSGIIVGITLLFLTPLLFHLPIATLAAVIIIAVVGMIEVQPFEHAWKVNPHDGFVALVVFLTTLYMAPHLEWGIFIGVALSLSLYIYRTMRPHFAEIAMGQDGVLQDAEIFGMNTSETLALYRYDGDLYFANASYLEKQLLNAVAEKQKLKVIILDLEAVDQIDATGEEMLTQMSMRLKEAGIEFYITRAKFRITDTLKKSGLFFLIGEQHFFSKRVRALKAIKEKYQEEVDISHLVFHKPLEDEETNSDQAMPDDNKKTSPKPSQ